MNCVLINIPQGKGRGHWFRTIIDELGDNPRYSAIVWCPECGKPLSAVNHSIGPDGQITPSLGHPVEYPPCGWHTHPKLIGWDPNPPALSALPKHECECCHRQSRSLGAWGMGWGYRLVCNQCIDRFNAASGDAP